MRRSKTKLGSKGTSAADKPNGGSLSEGRRVLRIEARAVQALIERLDDQFAKAVDLLFRCKGKVVVSGMGKSGLVGQKIAATMASTGTPAFFLHPADGIHGDLGMVGRADVLIAISNSGETQEILQLLPYVERLGIPVVSLTGRVNSTLAKNSDATLDVSVAEEACPMGLGPDGQHDGNVGHGRCACRGPFAEAGFKQEDFAQFHPGGTLGRRLLVRVRDLMHGGADMPVGGGIGAGHGGNSGDHGEETGHDDGHRRRRQAHRHHHRRRFKTVYP